MNSPMNSPMSNLGGNAASLVDSAAQTADNAIRSSQRVANQTLDGLADRVDEVRAQTGPALNRLATEAERLARRGVDAVREGSQQLRDQTLRTADSTVGYIKDEPVKAVLIAAAVGAALMALVAMVSRVGATRQ